MEKSRSKGMRCCPPSTSSVVPVMAGVASTKATAAATSCGVDDLPSGLCACSRSNAASLGMRWLLSVSPGAMAATRTRGASACASKVVAACRAALLKV